MRFESHLPEQASGEISHFNWYTRLVNKNMHVLAFEYTFYFSFKEKRTNMLEIEMTVKMQ